MTNAQEQNAAFLSATHDEGNNKFTILGRIVFWNIRNVALIQTELTQKLIEAGLSDSYAKEHNYRSAYLRALKSMEEQRLVRLVEETSLRSLYQFTQEVRIGQKEEAELEYNKEAMITIDKVGYSVHHDFSKAISCANSDIKNRVVELFEIEKKTFRSSDITRILQSIFTKQAEILPLREQGSIYFVPAFYSGLVESVKTLAGLIPGILFKTIPMPDVSDSRNMLKDAVEDSIGFDFNKLEKELETIDESTNPEWVSGRLDKLDKLKKRINNYASVLEEKSKFNMLDGIDKLIQSVAPNRKLDLGE